MNKKGTKFISARKTIPNVNLRGMYAWTMQVYPCWAILWFTNIYFEAGYILWFQKLQLSTALEPSDVRNAQVEFRKFDMENNGKNQYTLR